MEKYEVAIIGGGPGGYVTAIRLQQYGIKVVVFEKERLGGVCLNWGCIPTKSLVKVADLYHEMQNAEDFGIELGSAKVDYSKVWQRKNIIVEQLVGGIEFMFEKREIPVIYEKVEKIEKKSDFLIETATSSYSADYVILATGSQPKELPFMKFDGDKILSSRHIIDMSELPKSLAIVGGGVIGCEFASIYHQLGVEVQIVEFLPNLVSLEDAEVSKKLASKFKRNKMKVHLKKAVEAYEEIDDKIKLTLTKGKEIMADKVLVSVGRKPVCEIDFLGFDLQKKNDFIQIDDEMRTNCQNIFAIGDVTGKSMLAHTASKQGLIVADIISNQLKKSQHHIIKLNYNNIPACTFTNPEIASVGYTEKVAIEKYQEVRVGKFPFTANGNAMGKGDTYGFVKIVSSAADNKILGVHIIGLQATELIAQASALIGLDATIEDVKKIVFAHPTLSEAVMEAAEDLENLAIHKL
ncbi:MAG: dihydrolipoyl dehydrogenase [Candidatus Cloacimonadales bacterium]